MYTEVHVIPFLGGIGPFLQMLVLLPQEHWVRVMVFFQIQLQGMIGYLGPMDRKTCQ